MAKFCGKCGTRLDENTGLCPNCDSAQLDALNARSNSQEQYQWQNNNSSTPDNFNSPPIKLTRSEKKAKKKADKKAEKARKKADKKAPKAVKKASRTTGQKVRIFLLKLLAILLALIIIVSAVTGVLVYFNVVDIPFVYDILDSVGLCYSPDMVNDTPEKDISDFTYFETPRENVVTDSESGISYVNNELLITLIDGVGKEKLHNFLDVNGAAIVGQIDELNMYQIKFENILSYSEIEEIASTLEEKDWVDSASANLAIKDNTPQYIPNDKNWKNKWEDIPDGNNWGVEAIDAPSAWDYSDEMQSVNIGVIDTMFDVNHEDLNFAEIPLGNVKATQKYEFNNDANNHGTHVSGIIAAAFDNNKGISGVSIKSNLYGVSMKGLSGYDYDTLMSWKIALSYLIMTKNCKVVNISMGADWIAFEASRGTEQAKENIKRWSAELGNFIKLMLNNNYNFVICKSAGNQNEVGGGYKYFRKDEDDNENPYMYYSYSDYEKYLNGEELGEDLKKAFSRYKDRQKEIENRLESGNVDAQFDCFAAISDPEVKNRIIVVGSAKNNGSHKEGDFLGIGGTKVHDGYSIAKFSQCGKRVDVLAPGVEIYSAIKNGYQKMSGTSQATPHVSGTAGLIFSINPDLSGEDVKKIIVDSAIGEYGAEKYGMLNAKSAVEQAKAKKHSSDDSNNNSNLSDNSQIPSDAIECNGHYYKAYDVGMTWSDAKKACEDAGGYLATITTSDEDNAVLDLIHSGSKYFYWLGGTDEAKEGDWTWVTSETWSYENWISAQPNNHSDINQSDENYLSIEREKRGWNDLQSSGDPSGNCILENGGYICEWSGSDTASVQLTTVPPESASSDERDIVLVLDTSGSMDGKPIEETKKAATKFVDTILEDNASIGIVNYDDDSTVSSPFSNSKSSLESVINALDSGGSTNIEAGLRSADQMLSQSSAKKKIIVLMSDGEPNKGLVGDSLISYADELKEKGIYIYTLGFFESIGDKTKAQTLMEKIASEGCHYEVSDADSLVFFFGDIADQINGQKYIYVRIACPVDVSVSFNGETLDSSDAQLNTRTSFGSLTFEQSATQADYDSYSSQSDSGGYDDRVKILRLKEGENYDIRIEGTARGRMNYSIGFMDENGEYSDFRKFKNIKIKKNTLIDTVANVSDKTVLNVDEDGDGKYDLTYQAEANGNGKLVDYSYIIYIIVAAAVVLIILITVLVIRSKLKKRKQYKNI